MNEKVTLKIVKKDYGLFRKYDKLWSISLDNINLLFLKSAAHSHFLLSNLIWRRKDIYWSIDILNIDKTVPMHLLSIYSLYYKHIFYIHRYITKYNIYNTINKVTRHTATQLSEKLYQAFLGFPRPETKKIINLM